MSTPFHLKVGHGPEHIFSNGADVTVEHDNFPAATSSGWHSHGGPIFVEVVSGALTTYEKNDPTCTPRVFGAGTGFMEETGDIHDARNETGGATDIYVEYILPPGSGDAGLFQPAPDHSNPDARSPTDRLEFDDAQQSEPNKKEETMRRRGTLAIMLAGGVLLSACGNKSGSGANGSSSTAPPTAARPTSSTTTGPAPTTTLAPIATFSVTWSEANCPPGTPDTTSCYANTGTADIAGLGPATENYTLLAEGTNQSCGDWRADVGWTVAGKGTIEFAIKSPRCQSLNSPNGTTNYVVTGGSGAYKGVSGSGTVDSTGHETAPGRGTGTDRWNGTLSALSHGSG